MGRPRRQSFGLRSILREVDPGSIGYIEAHGTGTSLGDPIEVGALGAVFAKGRDANRPLIIGSVKSNIGHLEAAAGVAGLIKVVLALQRREIPPNLHFQSGNPRIDWAALPIVVPTAVTPWPQIDGRRLAGISSFGFSGTNAHVIVEEAPDVKPVPTAASRIAHCTCSRCRRAHDFHCSILHANMSSRLERRIRYRRRLLYR